MNIVEIGAYCRKFRIEVLNMTLQEVSPQTNVKTLSAFEHGRSKNIMHIFKYLEICSNRNDRIYFMKGLCELMEVEIDG